MLHFTHHPHHARPKPIRPSAHGALAGLALIAMLVAVLLPSQGTGTLAVAASSGSTAPASARSVPVDATSADAPLGLARTVDTAQDAVAQRHAEAPVDAAPPAAPAAAASREGDAGSASEGEASLEVVSELGQHPDEPGAQSDEKEKGKGNQADRAQERTERSKARKAERVEKRRAEAAAASPFPEGPSRLFARHDGMHLFTPSADPVRIGFHEAAYGNAVGMIPLGRAIGNDNGHKYKLPPLTPTDQQYLVLSSRGRPHHATSAVDIVMRPGEPVRSVVTGMVVEVRPYMLYGVHPDAMVRIRSAEDNGKIVTMLHVTGTKVHVGQQVVAGKTIVADSATSFPFLSQIDYYLGSEPHPHVHVEVKRG